MGDRVRDGDGRAKRVAHERGPLDSERFHEPVERAGEVGQPVARAGLRGGAEAREVERVHGRPRRESAQGVAPGLGEPAQAVHQDDGGPTPLDEVVEIEPVDFAAPKPEFWHEATILPNRRRPTRDIGGAPAARASLSQANRSGGEESAAGLSGRPRSRLSMSARSEEHTSELQSLAYLVCRFLLAKIKKKIENIHVH